MKYFILGLACFVVGLIWGSESVKSAPPAPAPVAAVEPPHFISETTKKGLDSTIVDLRRVEYTDTSVTCVLKTFHKKTKKGIFDTLSYSMIKIRYNSHEVRRVLYTCRWNDSTGITDLQNYLAPSFDSSETEPIIPGTIGDGIYIRLKHLKPKGNS